MKTRTTLHFVDGNSRSRAELSRMAFAMGHHCEVYADLAEIFAHPPREGIVVATDDPAGPSIPEIIDQLMEAGIWLPVIALSPAPELDRTVAAMRAGAIGYLAAPLAQQQIEQTIAALEEEAEHFAAARKRLIEARRLVAALSSRERDVLDRLAQGNSNKAIARDLGFSPRTVEIHRANMMSKLGARHPADAVRVRLEAGS